MIFGNEKELDDLVNQYTEKFKRNFPMFMMMGTPEAELIKTIRNALDTGCTANHLV